MRFNCLNFDACIILRQVFVVRNDKSVNVKASELKKMAKSGIKIKKSPEMS